LVVATDHGKATTDDVVALRPSSRQSLDDFRAKLGSCGLCPHHDKTMTSEQSPNHPGFDHMYGKTMTSGLCSGHFISCNHQDNLNIFLVVATDHGKAMTDDVVALRPSSRQSLDDFRAKLGSYGLYPHHDKTMTSEQSPNHPGFGHMYGKTMTSGLCSGHFISCDVGRCCANPALFF
jgi:hypothetical protein